MYVLEIAHLSKTQEAKLNLAEIKMLRFSFKPAGAGFGMIQIRRAVKVEQFRGVLTV